MNTHLQLALRLRMGGAIPLPPTRFIDMYRDNFTFIIEGSVKDTGGQIMHLDCSKINKLIYTSICPSSTSTGPSIISD